MSMLSEILARKAEEVRALRQRGPVPIGIAAAPVRDFAGALRATGLSVVAEIKRRSPSAGVLRSDMDVAALAQCYARGGAAAISCLTDRTFFSAESGDLPCVRGAIDLPVLRKDFIIDPAQIAESRAMGADAVLLIVRILSQELLRELLTYTHALGLAALVEVHDDPELDRAVESGARIIGVNNRDLDTLRVDIRTALRLAGRIPSDCVRVAESGISTPDDARAMQDAGFDAILVGEALLRSADPAALIADLVTAATGHTETAR